MTAANTTRDRTADDARRDAHTRPAVALLSPSVWRGWDSMTTALLAPATGTRS